MQIHHLTAGGGCVHRNHKPIRTGREAVEKAQAVVNRIAKGGRP